MNTAYELVHSDLLMGNHRPHARPITIPATPERRSLPALAADTGAPRSHWPVSTPKSVVAMAGMVLRMPSGS